jgi:hypothetical protein
VTLLVFLPASAKARIIPANWFSRPNWLAGRTGHTGTRRYLRDLIDDLVYFNPFVLAPSPFREKQRQDRENDSYERIKFCTRLW